LIAFVATCFGKFEPLCKLLIATETTWFGYF